MNKYIYALAAIVWLVVAALEAWQGDYSIALTDAGIGAANITFASIFAEREAR